MINRDRLKQLRAIEDERFLKLHPKSGVMFKAGQVNMPGGVPMSWMAKWPGAYPVFVKEAKGARFSDVDGNTYIDFCLGDTGSMTGHSPDATVAAIREQVGKGITAMLPTADAAIVSAELAARFGLPLWQFTVSATDANRHVIRYSRMITQRSKIVVTAWNLGIDMKRHTVAQVSSPNRAEKPNTNSPSDPWSAPLSDIAPF